MTKMINTFNQGLDRDSSKNKYDNTHYYDAKNFRLVTQEGLSGGALENQRGTEYRFTLYDGSTSNYICGHVVMKDWIILWTSTNNTGTPNGASSDRIWKVAIADFDALLGSPGSFSIDSDWFWSTGHLIYVNNMYLCKGNRVKAIARYESDTVQKVYWMDGYNRLRHINLVYDADTNDLVNMDVEKLDLIGDIEFTQPDITELVEGNLSSGRVQYGYQLYNLYGAETIFSPLSGLVNLTSYSDTGSTSEDYRGSEIDEATGKGVKGTIEITTTGYTRIRIIAVQYTSLNGDPSIRVIEEREIDTAGETIVFVDTGSSIGTFTLEDIRTVGTLLFTPQDIETKDNILFAANITEESFDMTYDARAYRFSGASASTGDSNYNAVRNRKARIFQEDDTYYEIDGSTKVVSGTAPYASGSWTALAEDIDGINKFNDLDNDGDHEYRYLYQSDGVVLGGEGPNVSYAFKIKEIIIDDDTATIRRLYTSVEGTADNPSFTCYASPYNSEKYMGHQRDETYRYGLVGFDGKGRSSFVKWIGDIRTPSISTLADSETYNLAGGSPTAQAGTITISAAASQIYWVTFGGHTYSFDNIVAGLSDTNLIASALRNVIITTSPASGQVTCGAPVAGVFTITWDLAYGSYSVTTSTNVVYNQTQAYVPGVGAFSDFSICWNDPGDGYTKANILYIEFTVENLPAEVVGYQIVRVKRETGDRSVMAQGLIGGTSSGGGGYTSLLWQTSSGFTDLYTFQSPEVAFNKNLVRQSADHLQEIGELVDNVSIDTTDSDLIVYKYWGVNALTHPQYRISGVPTAGAGDEFYSNAFTDIVAGRIVRQDETEAIIGTNTFNVNDSSNNVDKGISFVFEADNSSWRCKNVPYTHATDGRKLVNYRRNVFNSQYGGITYNRRRQNIYVPASEVSDAIATTVNAFYGDTFIGMFDYLYLSWEQDSATSTQPEVIYFPCETSINMGLRLDDPYHLVYSATDANKLHETAGVWGDGVGNDYAQVNDLYRYNTVYSKENDTMIFISPPFDWAAETEFPVRVRASEVKVTGELTDSWLSFKANSYKDVDPQYDEITRLVTLNDRLLFFQPKAFGVVSVNERALLQTGDISQLSLGTSGILDRFDYAKTGIGASNRRHVLLSPNGLYWIDTINKAMYKYTGGPEEISLMKGMDSFFRTSLVNPDETFLFYDPEFKEVNVNDYTDDWTLVYSELVDSFTGFCDFFPEYVINYEDKLMGTRNNLLFYRHNDPVSNRVYLYANYYDSYITLLVNPDNENVSLFNNLEWLTEAYTSAGVDTPVTFDEITLYNDYQHSGVITLTPGSNVRRRMRKWRYDVPRSIYKRDGSTPQDRRDARFRDSHLFIKLSFTNDANDRRFVSHDIMTSFITSNK